MAKIIRVAPDPNEVSDTPQTVEEAIVQVASVQKDFDILCAERAQKRDTSPRAEWRAYNEATTDQQLAVMAALDTAERVLSRLSKTDEAKTTVHVGAAVESNKAGTTNG